MTRQPAWRSGRARILFCVVVAAAASPAAGSRGDRGIAVLSSSIGRDVDAAELLAYVDAGRINLVVVDFAWVTHHWPRTDLWAVERLCRELRRRGVRVAAMYRPRVLRSQEARVHCALGPGGPAADHNELCFAYDDSCAWACGWGSRILDALPAVDRLILYNVRATCACERCRDGAGRAHAEAFVRRCRSEWRRARAGVLVGHVGVGDEYADAVDFLCPFIAVNRGSEERFDPAPAIAGAAGIGAALGPDRVLPLLKVCWAAETRNDAADVARAIASCEEAGVGFILWYFEWVFHNRDGTYDRGTVLAALGTTEAAVRAARSTNGR
jgi:hypothetical protein